MQLLVVDDHSLIREAVRHVLQALAASVTVLTAGDCDEGFAIAERESELEVLLLDFNLRGVPTGVSAIQAWRQRHPALPVVVLSSVEDQATVLAAMAAGAAGFIPKSSSNEVMLSALRLVLAGGRYLPVEVLARSSGGPALASEPTSVESLRLSPRQLEVLLLIARGMPNKIICSELGLAERTVKAHVTEVLRALGVSNRTQACRPQRFGQQWQRGIAHGLQMACVGLTGEDGHRHRMSRAQAKRQLQAAHTTGQPQIGQQGMGHGSRVLEGRPRGCLVGRQPHLHTPLLQLTAHGFTHRSVVIDHQHTTAMQRVEHATVHRLRRGHARTPPLRRLSWPSAPSASAA